MEKKVFSLKCRVIEIGMCIVMLSLPKIALAQEPQATGQGFTTYYETAWEDNDDDYGESPQGISPVKNAQNITTPYNFVIIMTDDQRWDTLWAMPDVQKELIRNGVAFQNAFVSTSLCCPSRSSFLSGGYYAHNTGVLNNNYPNGGVDKFNDTNSLPVLLKNEGYKTALIGKYLNNYDPALSPKPKGWTEFVPWQYYFNSTMATNDTNTTNITYFLQTKALDFLNTVGNDPFFLYFATTAPHSPAKPAPGDEDLFEGYLNRGRAYAEGERNQKNIKDGIYYNKYLKDKPTWVKEKANKFYRKMYKTHIKKDGTESVNKQGKNMTNLEVMDEFHRDQLRSLQAVDRAVAAIVEKLEEVDKLKNTMIVFTSDNGYLWGEHGLVKKGVPYEEAIRVPLVVVLPGMDINPREDRHRVISNLDVPATILELANITPGQEPDGASLVPLLLDPDVPWRPKNKWFLIEGYGKFSESVWSGLRGWRYKYVEYAKGEKEFYDLREDPYELENQADNSDFQELREKFAQRLNSLKGLAINVKDMPVAPQGVVGKAYNFQLTAWGGKPPYTWDMYNGTLPQGLSLNSSTGKISGKPSVAGNKTVLIKVQDKSIAKYTGKPQEFIGEFQFVITSANITMPPKGSGETDVPDEEEEDPAWRDD